VRGKMLWFNEKKDLGFIMTDEGERLSVLGTAFTGGKRPVGRCAHRDVEFEIDSTGEERRAENVILVEPDAPRRARMRGRGVRH
jgi:hypothetical protein